MNQSPDNYDDGPDGGAVCWLAVALAGVLILCAVCILCGCTHLTYKNGDTKATYTAIQNPFFLQSPEATYTPSNGTFRVVVKREDAITDSKIKTATEAAVKAALKP